MYKTVRHGENSLQYTILPQTEEVLSNSGLRGKGRDYSPSVHMRRSRKKSTAKYILLVIFGIIVALALASVPLYLMHKDYFTRNLQTSDEKPVTSAPLTPTAQDIVKSRKKVLKTLPEPVVASIPKTLILPTLPTTTATQASTVIEKKRTWSTSASPYWKSTTSSKMPPMRMLGSHDDIPLITASPNDPPEETVSPTVKTTEIHENMVIYHEGIHIRPTAKGNAKVNRNLVKTEASTQTTATMKEPTDSSKLEDLKDMLFSDDEDDDFKNSLEVDDVFTLPPLKSDYPALASDDVTVSKTTNTGWYGARWPFVDTSSYFQWTGYSPGDNLLLPLLVAALSSIALVLLLTLAVRRRKRNYANTANNTALAADVQPDDNTNLLTAENPEDPEDE